MDERSYTRLGWLIVLVGVCGFLVWAMYAPLDKGVPITGTVITEGNRKSVQHAAGGIIKTILVKDGDVVKPGQLLVRMDTTQLKANTNGVRESIQGLEFMIRGLQESRASKLQQLDLLEQQLTGMRELANDGYVAKNRVLELERQAVQIRGGTFEDAGNIGRNQKQISELRERIAGYQYELTNADVTAPVEGMVQGLAVFTQRGFVSPGMRLLDIVPLAEVLVVEGQAPPHLIDKIRVGLDVDMSFTAFNQNRTPHIAGKVAVVSADRLLEERTGNPYYKIKVQITPQGMEKLKGLEVRAGMPVDVFIKTGERSLMSYLIKPMVDRLQNALSQE
jgi:protease secretion system membrane fusion protein